MLTKGDSTLYTLIDIYDLIRKKYYSFVTTYTKLLNFTREYIIIYT